MHFISPGWLLLLLVVAVLVAVYAVLQRRRVKYVARFSNVELLGSVAPRRPGWRRHLTFALLMLGLAVLSVGVAQPTGATRVPRDRATVMLAIDVSLSMEATDVLPSRIGAAKSAAVEFVGLLPTRINLGLVDFGGTASLLVSPTLDRAPIRTAIGKMQLQNSTAIGEAIFTSLQAINVFEASTTASGQTPPPARIVLLSDGSNTVGRGIDQAIAAARKAHVEISTIAFGTPTGTVTYQGQTIPVPADNAALAQIADQTGGSFHAAHSQQELEGVYKNIGSQIGYQTKQHDISWRFLMVGLLLTLGAAGTSMLWAGRLV
jgi:Ca-activated chloride channel family protein